MKSRRHAVSAVAAMLALASASSGALAQPASSDASEATKELARDAYALGNALAEQGQWREALAAFTRSASLHPHPATSFNVAYCERALGNDTRARKFFRQALAQHADSQQLAAGRARQAESYLSELEQRIVRLHVTLSPGARVTVDGASLEEELPIYVAVGATSTRGTTIRDESLDVLVNPGSRKLTARGGEGELVEVQLQLQAGERRAVSLQFPPQRPPSHTLGRWSTVVIGAGAAGLVAGAAFGVAALQKQALLDERCPEPARCPPQHAGDIATLQRSARASTIALSIGGVVAAAGAALFIYDRATNADNEVSPKEGTATVTPTGLSVSF